MAAQNMSPSLGPRAVRLGKKAGYPCLCHTLPLLLGHRNLSFSSKTLAEPGVVGFTGDPCSIDSKAFVVYDNTIGDVDSLEELSIVMKCESLPGQSRWEGAPSHWTPGWTCALVALGTKCC